MKKKLVITLVLIAAACFLVIAFTQKAESPKLTKEQVLEKAEQYFLQQKDLACGQAITQAVHTETGYTHTFNTTCLPPGWSPVR